MTTVAQQNQRKHPRYTLPETYPLEWVSLNDDAGEHLLWLHDISLEGIGVISSDSFKLGQEKKVLINCYNMEGSTIPEKEINCKVCWIETDDKGINRIGLQFTEMTQEIENKVNFYQKFKF